MADVGMEEVRGPDNDSSKILARGVREDQAVRQTPESICLEKEVRETLLARCLSLKPPYDEIARAYYYDEMDTAEIAKARGAKVKTVQTQIYRARSMLRKMYIKEKGA